MFHFDIAEEGKVRTVGLGDGSYVIGRAIEADVRLETPSVSRMHARIEIRDSDVWVEDLGSLWGTFVGGHRLTHGRRHPFPQDELLRVAGVEIWAHDRPRPRNPSPDEFEYDTTGFGAGDGHHHHSPPPRGRTLPMLRHLFQLFGTADAGHAIEEEACLFVKNWIDADRVCLYEADEAGVAPRLRSWWSRRPLDPGNLLISERMIDSVLATGEPIVWCREETGDELTRDDSRYRFQIKSVIAVPILASPAIRGVFYADRRRNGEGFGEEDLEILTATASAVAMRRSVCRSRIDLAEAARIQRRMLPRSLPTVPGYELDAGLQMCLGVGGDLYDCIRRSEQQCLFAVGDVSGKGLPAALLMGATSFLIRALAELELPPLEIYARVHRNLLAKFEQSQFVALFLGELHRASGILRCVVAGVPMPLVIRSDGTTEELPPTAIAAALMDLEVPAPEEIEVRLEPGDLLVVFTDGYPEATPDGERFLESAVIDQLVHYRFLPLPEIRARLDQAVAEFVGLAGPSDDRTMLLLRREN